MRSTIRDFVVGLTAILGLAGLVIMLWMFGDLPFARTATYGLKLKLDNAGGILPAAPITLNGVRVGVVRTTLNSEDPREGVVLTLAIDKKVRLPRDVSVAILRDFVGASTLSLTAANNGKTGTESFFQPDETFESKAYAPGLTGELSALLDKRLATLDSSVAKFNALADEYTQVGKRINSLLEPRTIEDVQGGKSPANLMSTIERFDRAVAEARTWLGDDGIKTDARAAVKNISSTLDKASGLVDSWTTTAHTLTETATKSGANFDEAMKGFAASTRSLNDTLHEIQGITAKVAQGDGTVGLLLNNPDLYRNLNDAASRLEKALTEAQLLIEKYRKEGIPIQF